LHIAFGGQWVMPRAEHVPFVFSTTHVRSSGGGGGGGFAVGNGCGGVGSVSGGGAGRGGFAMIVGDCDCGGGGVGRGSLTVGWPGSGCAIDCEGGVEDCRTHAGAIAHVITNGAPNLRRGVRADIRRR
jgi:hypothetical protein